MKQGETRESFTLFICLKWMCIITSIRFSSITSRSVSLFIMCDVLLTGQNSLFFVLCSRHYREARLPRFS